MKDFLSKFKSVVSKNYFNSGVLLCLIFVAVIILLPQPASAAGVADWFGNKIILGVSWIVYGIASFLGLLATFLINWISQVATWNHFIDVDTVMKGWKIVRDLCNMFFILILLVIAFATILRVESYSWKKNLPKLLIMAVLINFSKTICGLIIDFSQVIMLTFVSSFAGAGTNNFTSLLGIDNILAFAKKQDIVGADQSMSTLWGLLAAVFFSIIVVIVLGVLFVTLVFRVMMLWVYIILSPLAFFLSTFTAGQKYSQQWWGDFSKQVIVGPVLAFFIWLALSTAQVSSSAINNATDLNNFTGGGGIMSGMMEDKVFQTYIITISLLIGGLMVTQQIGGIAGAAAGKGLNWAKKSAVVGLAGVGGGAAWINRKQAKHLTGFDFSPKRQLERMKAGLARSERQDLTVMQSKASANLQKGGLRGAITGFTATSWMDEYWGARGLKKAVAGNFGRPDKLQGRYLELKDRASKMTTKEDFDRETEDMKKHAYSAQLANHEVKMAELSELGKNEKDSAKKARIDEEYYRHWGAAAELKEKIPEKQAEIERERNAEFANRTNSNLVFKNSDELQQARTQTQAEAAKYKKNAASYAITDYEGRADFRAAVSKEASKVTSDNEDELITQFAAAMAKKDQFLAAALIKQIAKVGGMNALLQDSGYNDTTGFNAENAARLANGTKEERQMYAAERGFNDFVRDSFVGKLGMNEQMAYSLQSDLSELNNDHGYMHKTVTVNQKNGKLLQSDRLSGRTETVVTEWNKGEIEGKVRKGHRLGYGSESSGSFKFHEEGLAFVMANWETFQREINQKRLNPSTAAAFTSPLAMEQLRRGMEKLVAMGAISNEQQKAFIQSLSSYALTKSVDNRKGIIEGSRGAVRPEERNENNG